MATATKHGLPPEAGVIEFNNTAGRLGYGIERLFYLCIT